MTLEQFYEIYKLHRKHSVGVEISKDNPLYEEGVTVDSYEDEVGEYWLKMLKALEKDYNLCLEVFKTFELDFFLWFTWEFCEWFENILNKHKKIELLQVLKQHVYSFNDSIATKRMNEIYNNSIKFCE